MKLLNLDQVAKKTNKSIVIKGVQHTVMPLSVGAFVKKTQEAEEYVKAGEKDPIREINMILDLLAECVPSASRLDIESLSLEQLQQMADYIRKDDVDGAEDVEGNV